MMQKRTLMTRWAAAIAVVAGMWQATAMDIVKNGEASATIVTTTGKSLERNPWGSSRVKLTDDVAAWVLIDWIEQITDVRLPVATAPQAGHGALYLGGAAEKEGRRRGGQPGGGGGG